MVVKTAYLAKVNFILIYKVNSAQILKTVKFHQKSIKPLKYSIFKNFVIKKRISVCDLKFKNSLCMEINFYADL